MKNRYPFSVFLLLAALALFWFFRPGEDGSPAEYTAPTFPAGVERVDGAGEEVLDPETPGWEEAEKDNADWVQVDPVEEHRRQGTPPLPEWEVGSGERGGERTLISLAEARGMVFPRKDNEELARELSPPQDRFWQTLRASFPEVDLTEVQEFQEMVADHRGTLGFELNDETVALFRSWMTEADALHREMVILRANGHGLSLGGLDEEGRGYALVGFEEGRPVYTITSNVEAAISTGANLVRWNFDFDPALGGSVDGRNLYVNINDYEEIREHNEFQLPDNGGSRILVAETPWYSASGNHMTHVTGTVTAWGYNNILTGMAPRAWIRSLIQQTTSHVTAYAMQYPGERHNLVNPRTGEMQMKSVLGNTSLGTETPNTRYTSGSRTFDIVLRDFPYYVHFYAASNSGSGFETLGGNNPVGKNVMSIGAVQDVNRDADGNYLSGGNIAGFSSRGPAFDGRIKPDFTANGVGVRSTSGTSGSSSLQGTSMASPNAAGSTLLLIDYVHQRFPGHFFRSSTYKSLLMNTADDRGNPGPDYIFGWGIINVHGAGKILRHHAENSYHRVVREERLHPGQSWTYTYESDGTQPIRASLAWLDVAGASQSTTSDDRSPRLVNDLDLRITGPGGTVYQPFVMPFVIGQGSTPAFDSSLRNTPATTGDNFTDPAEQILIASPAAGTYTVQVTHKGTLSSGQPQPFSLSVSGMVSATAAPAVIASVSPNEGNDSDNFAMAVLGSGFVLGSDVLLRRDGSPVVTAYRVVPVGDRIDFRVDTDGIDRGYYDVVVRAPDGTESVLENGFLMPVGGGSNSTVTLYSNTFQNADGLTLTGNWEVGIPDQGSVGGPGRAYTGDNVLGTYLNGNYANNINIFATLPPISTVNRTNIQLEFRRWLGVAYATSGQPASRPGGKARLHYSIDEGQTWSELFSNGNSPLIDNQWSPNLTYNLPSNQAQVLVRFQLETDNYNVHSFGWNIDDLRITGETSVGLLLPPVFTSTPPTTAVQDEVFSYSVTTADEDTPGSGITLTAETLPAGLTFIDNGDGTGLLSGSPSVSGSFAITLAATDGDYTTWQVFDLLIFPVGGNTAPEILTETIPAANEAQFYETVVEAIDADGHALAFSVSPLPSWLSLTDHGDGTATLSGTPNVVSTYSITVTVTDGFETDQKTYSLNVNPRPLVGFTVNSVDVDEDVGTVTVQVARTLNEAGEVTVSYATQNGEAVAGHDYVATSGTLSWADGEMGSKPITVTINDDELTQGDREFTIALSNLSSIATMGTSVLTVTILDNNNNTPPEITLTSPSSNRVAVPPGMGLLVSGEVSDDGLPDWGTYSQGWTVAGKPEGATVTFSDENEINTGVTFSHQGSYSLLFTADDGEFSSSVSLNVEVADEVSVGLPTDHLAVWLPLDESGGSVAGDASGNNRSATLTGSPTWQPSGGALGGALQFTGSSQRGEIADSAGLNNVNRMSWAFWLNPAGSISGDQGILGKRTSTSNNNKDWGFWFKANSSNRITFDLGATRTETSTTIPANEWTHVAFVFDGTLDQGERMRFYVNGDLVQALAVGSTTIQNNNVNVTLASFQLDDTRNFVGMMDEVVIYHGRALDAEEVQQIIAGGGGNLGPEIAIDPIVGAQAQEPIQVSAVVTDDGLPEEPGAVSLEWIQVAGPGPVAFDDGTVADPLVTFPVAGTYILRLSAHDGQVTTFAEVEVLVEESGPFAPILFSQPESLLRVAGDSATFSVGASGNPEPTYQWYFNGGILAGATEATYVIPTVGPEHEGTYQVRVTNDLGQVESDPVILELLSPPAAPVGFSAQAISHLSIVLNWVDPSDSPDLTEGFEIETSANGTGGWEPLAEVTETEYLDSGLVAQTTRYYRVRAFNAAGVGSWSAIASATTMAGAPEEILLYQFTHDAEGVNPTFAAEGLVSGPAVAGAGLNRFRTDEGGALNTLSVVNDSTRTDVDQAFLHDEYFTITLAPEEGQTLSLDTLDFKVTRGGSSGERNFAVRSSLAPTENLLGPKNVVSVRGSWDLESIDLTGPEFQGLTSPVTFYFIVATSGTTLSVEFDDISFVGMLTSTTATGMSYATWVTGYESLSEGESGPLDSPAGDGLANLLKYAFGLSPLERSSDPGPWVEQVEVGGQNHLSLRFPARAGGLWNDLVYTVDGIHYVVETSTDLLSWYSGSEYVQVHDHSESNGEGISEVVVRRTIPISGNSRQFMRLRVEMVE